MVIISNSSRRASTTMEKLKTLGFDPSLFVGAITSGELTYQYLERLSIIQCKLSICNYWQFKFTGGGQVVSRRAYNSIMTKPNTTRLTNRIIWSNSNTACLIYRLHDRTLLTRLISNACDSCPVR